MPIRPKTETPAPTQVRVELPSPPPRRRIKPVCATAEPNQIEATPPPPEKPKRNRGHARKDARGKWQPTGEGTGFANPPKEHRFKKNGKGGPGRPKGSISYDGLVKKHLTKKRTIRIDGEEKTVTHAELLIMSMIKDAIEGKNRDARRLALTDLARIFSDEQRQAGQPLTASEEAMLEELLRSLVEKPEGDEP